MQATYVQAGEGIEFLAASDITRGDVVVQGELVGVATADVSTGELGTVTVDGVFDFVKDSAVGVTCSSHADVLFQPQVLHLMLHSAEKINHCSTWTFSTAQWTLDAVFG